MSHGPIKIGFRTAGYREWPLHRAFRSLGQLGYDGVEICLEHPEARPETLTPGQADELAAAARHSGLAIASVSYHGDDDPDELRAQNQRRALSLTRHLGAELLILNAQKAVPGREEKQWQAFRGQLETLLEVAQAEGVLIALEPEPGHFLHSSADMVRLLHEMGSPCLKVNLDIGHAFLTDPDVTRTIRTLAASIVHVHIEDMPVGVHQHLVPGEGDIDLPSVHDALRGAGYSGYYTVDLFDIASDPEA